MNGSTGFFGRRAGPSCGCSFVVGSGIKAATVFSERLGVSCVDKESCSLLSPPFRIAIVWSATHGCDANPTKLEEGFGAFERFPLRWANGTGIAIDLTVDRKAMCFPDSSIASATLIMSSDKKSGRLGLEMESSVG